MSDVDLTPLAAALAKAVEDIARKVIADAVPEQIKAETEQSLKSLLPGLVESALAEEKVLIKETVGEITRQALPDMVKPMVDQLAKEIIEKAVAQVVPDQAEAAVKKELERLSAEV